MIKNIIKNKDVFNTIYTSIPNDLIKVIFLLPDIYSLNYIFEELQKQKLNSGTLNSFENTIKYISEIKESSFTIISIYLQLNQFKKLKD
ncbi:hypothetical protein ABWH96_10025 [Marivirga tractuosa]|uniref:hypothetical protein n=1 Tax=Marivirga tractuosa TaxID=1006 RepID=UPI0035CFF25D